MVDIEIIVKIDANVYTRLFDNSIQDNEIVTDDICEMARALRLGKPLPNCKDCIYFHSYHEIERVPHITAHNVCYRWGNKCFTKEDGYCYLFEPKEESEGTHKVRWINDEMTTIDPQIKKDFREMIDKMEG